MKNQLLEQAYEIMKGIGIQWAFCGGYAVDLFLDKQTRKHSDIDICVFEQERERIANHMMISGWPLFQFLGGGKVRRLHIGDRADPHRNLMAVKDSCSLIKFYPCDGDVLWYEFYHTGIKRLDYIEFLFNQMQNDDFMFDQELDITREMKKAVLFNGKLPYIAPEIALLYKAANADNPEYQRDYDAAIPCLDAEQVVWLQSGLEKLYPQGHHWLKK